MHTVLHSCCGDNTVEGTDTQLEWNVHELIMSVVVNLVYTLLCCARSTALCQVHFIFYILSRERLSWTGSVLCCHNALVFIPGHTWCDPALSTSLGASANIGLELVWSQCTLITITRNLSVMMDNHASIHHCSNRRWLSLSLFHWHSWISKCTTGWEVPMKSVLPWQNWACRSVRGRGVVELHPTEWSANTAMHYCIQDRFKWALSISVYFCDWVLALLLEKKGARRDASC